MFEVLEKLLVNDILLEWVVGPVVINEFNHTKTLWMLFFQTLVKSCPLCVTFETYLLQVMEETLHFDIFNSHDAVFLWLKLVNSGFKAAINLLHTISDDEALSLHSKVEVLTQDILLNRWIDFKFGSVLLCKQWFLVLINLLSNMLAHIYHITGAFVSITTKCFPEYYIFCLHRHSMIIHLPPHPFDSVIDIRVVVTVFSYSIMDHNCM